MYLSFSTCPTVHASLDYCCSSTCAKINFTKLLKDDSVSRKLLSIFPSILSACTYCRLI